MSIDAARMDRVYVVLPEMEYTNKKGDSPSHRVRRFLTVHESSPGPRQLPSVPPLITATHQSAVSAPQLGPSTRQRFHDQNSRTKARARERDC